jgi:hypothetical protein
MAKGFVLYLLLIGLCFFVVFVPVLEAQAPVPARSQLRWPEPVRMPLGLTDITSKAGMIFSGRVLAIAACRSTPSTGTQTIRITFQVEDAIRGTRTGDQLTISEWAGLWTAGERYRVGERAMLFLYPPSHLELTSPVGGAQGRIAIDRSGRMNLSTLQLQAARRTNISLRTDANGRIAAKDFARAIRRLAQE